MTGSRIVKQFDIVEQIVFRGFPSCLDTSPDTLFLDKPKNRSAQALSWQLLLRLILVLSPFSLSMLRQQ